MWPSKELPQATQLRLLANRAERRYLRRKRACDWFWHWAQKRWNGHPRPSTKVAYSTIRSVPLFATFRPRVTYYTRLDGRIARLNGRHIQYEDCVHLAEQALRLWCRLLLRDRDGEKQ